MEARLDKWFKDYGQNKADFEWMLCELTLPDETENDENHITYKLFKKEENKGTEIFTGFLIEEIGE